jgi:2-keto-4-pentenoate hydratase/2-oxohepta-3-ene-1,7-dioic acid hydratase in catechol pathway
LIDAIAGNEIVLQHCAVLKSAAQSGDLRPAWLHEGTYAAVAPIPRPLKNVFCVGKNYAEHVSEAARALRTDSSLPEYQVFFSKPPTAVIGPDARIRLDPAVSDKMDYEVELASIIGTAGRDIPADRAMQHVFGFSILNDITARDVQRRHGGQFLKGKGLDTSCPLGPSIVTIDELTNFDNLAIRLSVNGQIRQDGNTRDMIFAIPALIESLSAGITLEPGDIIATGTPSGVGYAMEPPQFLKHGDVVTCQIEGIGELTNGVVDVRGTGGHVDGKEVSAAE